MFVPLMEKGQGVMVAAQGLEQGNMTPLSRELSMSEMLDSPAQAGLVLRTIPG
ncbi:hypothetical protein NJA15_00580 [Escherichia coli]|uniref:hypothetical protein n=1 Tax=Escherichia coli TaxID=562 RepID=UPI00209B40B7|nr:hypothetical protein [Escherichia coli]MCO7755278.1 hypothetical protein [Escherichia coli]MCO7765291.1 hypothetical protein [Escherichia coli]